MKTRRIVGFFFVWGLALVSSSSAATHYVNVSNATPTAPYTNWATASTNIQMAIVWSDSGDEILVAPGTYRLYGSPLELPEDKTLALRSTQSRAAVIDAQRLSPVLWIRGNDSLVEGFAVRNGLDAGYAGGIDVSAACTIRDCLVTSNQAWGGGGIQIYASGTVVENCTIQSNLATYFGAGVLFYGAPTSRVQNCIISDNLASNYGGGVYFQNGGSVSNCRIAGNRALGTYGGGVYLDQGGELVNSVVVDNFAEQDGGGVYSGGTVARMVPIVNCTIVSNVAGRESGGVYAAYNTFMLNDIIYFNTAPTNANLYNHSMFSIVSNCCLTPDYGLPNITNAPAFVNAGAGDYRLATASFCIDAGTANGAPGDDLEGKSRPRVGRPGGTPLVDMGAYEYGFHFNRIEMVSTNGARFEWDVQDRGIYLLDLATNAAADPGHMHWQSVGGGGYTNPGMAAGQFLVHTQTITAAGPIPASAIFRLRISHYWAK